MINTDGNLDALEKHLSEREEYDDMLDTQALIETYEIENEDLRAKLAKAVEALRDATQMLSQCTFTNIRIRGQYFERQEVVDKANAVLAELEGGE
jgi:DNA-directed RNA polymerase specialized sigma subunit